MTSPDRSATTVQQERRPGVMVYDSYGKSRVRLTKVNRHKDRHDLKEMIVDIQLEGDFSVAFTEGDNGPLVATDSMKNTVYVLAKQNPVDSIEEFAMTLAQHFVKTYKQVESATVHIAEELWHRIEVDGKPHPHSFYGANDEKHVVEVVATADSLEVESGIQGLKLVKTTDSEFSGFVRDKFTTLPDATDRIFGTSADVSWLLESGKHDFHSIYTTVRKVVLETFATHHSLGVQHTIHEIGQNALAKAAAIREITITMPNEHRILFNLKPFELDNNNEIFVATDEPYGLISATLRRE
ncbi:MAG TPA: urate oxidase [Planktothrix sp.]|jgi:urate oxidase